MRFIRTAHAFSVITITAYATVLSAECAPESWQHCSDKPWTSGAMGTPIGEPWWPNPLWGEGDEAGATNWYTQKEVVQRALSEVDQGKVYKLGRTYDADMPLFGTRNFALRIPATEHGEPVGANQLVWHDEFVATEFGQVGTQFDGLGHIGVLIDAPGKPTEKRWYNGFTEEQVGDPSGLKKLGIEKLHPIAARGILIDVAGAKGVERLHSGYEITLDDVSDALAKQGMAEFQFAPGDAVLFHTGWGSLWKRDNEQFNSGAPGIGMAVARWLTDDVQPGVVGSDSWPIEVVPNPDPGCAFCVHQHMITRHGILFQENMVLDDLINDNTYRFLYVFSPMPVTGATGSMGAPMAID